MDALSGYNTDMTMNLAAQSVQMANTDTNTQANVSVLKKSLDQQKAAAAELLKTMTPPKSLGSGSIFDQYA